MGEEMEDSDVGKAEGFVAELVDVGWRDSLDELFFEAGRNGSEGVEFLEIGGKLPVGFRDLGRSYCGDMSRCGARMDRLIEGDASRCKAVCCWSDGDGNMAKSAVAAKRGDRNGVGIDILVEEMKCGW